MSSNESMLSSRLSKLKHAVAVGIIVAGVYVLWTLLLLPEDEDSFLPTILTMPRFLVYGTVGFNNTAAVALSALFWFVVGTITTLYAKSKTTAIAICLGLAIALTLIMGLWLFIAFSQFPPV
jgi:hypothetical protein